MKKYILVIDIGTTNIRTLAFDIHKQQFFNIQQRAVEQIYPTPGWVEQDASEIIFAIKTGLKKVVQNLPQEEIVGLGLTNQRESIVAWDKSTGEPLYNAIIWQCRRTHDLCEKLKNDKSINEYFHSKTGLFPDSYFSATKIKWLIDNVYNVKEALKNNNLCIGTLDSFVIYNLTHGESFVTDHTNASRTLLYNIYDNDWDDELLQFFNIPRHILPEIINCDDYIADIKIADKTFPIGGIIGDQQSSLLGQGCVTKGDTKITYGTGAFMLTNIGKSPALSNNLLTTIAWRTREGTFYSFEGNMYSAGACINWLKDKIKIISSPNETESLVNSVPDAGGVFFIPALAGLGAPFWKSNARAELVGLTLGSSTAHIVRSVFNGIAYNTRAVFDEMNKYINLNRQEIKTDGGMTNNKAFVQIVSNSLNNEVTVSKESESTSLGACYMCGLAFGVYKDLSEIPSLYKSKSTFSPQKDALLEKDYLNWLKIVNKK